MHPRLDYACINLKLAPTLMQPSLKRPSSEIEPPMDGSPTKHIKTPHKDLSDDVAHKRMDNLVLTSLTDNFDPSSGRFGWATLLSVIVKHSEGRLDPKYVEFWNGQQLLDKHPELIKKLGEAWTTRKFREIRMIGTTFVLW